MEALLQPSQMDAEHTFIQFLHIPQKQNSSISIGSQANANLFIYRTQRPTGAIVYPHVSFTLFSTQFREDNNLQHLLYCPSPSFTHLRMAIQSTRNWFNEISSKRWLCSEIIIIVSPRVYLLCIQLDCRWKKIFLSNKLISGINM